jgi:hypothetical protein
MATSILQCPAGLRGIYTSVLRDKRKRSWADVKCGENSRMRRLTHTRLTVRFEWERREKAYK